MKKINKKMWISFVLVMSLSMAGMTVNAASASSSSSTESSTESSSTDADASSTDSSTTLRIPSSQTNTVPDEMTDSYQTYLNEKETLTEKGWTISEEHLNAKTDVYWLEGKTAEGAYFKYFSYDGADDGVQILASSSNVTYYDDLDKYWMDESTYDSLISAGLDVVGYAQKTEIVDDAVTTVYVGYVYYYPAS